MSGKLRRAGAYWRILVHRHETDGPESEMALHVQSDKVSDRTGSEYSQTTVLERTEFDELILGNGIAHIESLSTGVYWMAIAGVTVTVTADCDGKPTRVLIEGPGDLNPIEGCTYELNWSAE